MEKCHVEKQSQIRTTNVWGFERLGCGETQWGGDKAGAFVWTCNQKFLFSPVNKESLGDLNSLFWSTSLVWCDCQPQINSADTSSRMRMCGNVILNWIFRALSPHSIGKWIVIYFYIRISGELKIKASFPSPSTFLLHQVHESFPRKFALKCKIMKWSPIRKKRKYSPVFLEFF